VSGKELVGKFFKLKFDSAAIDFLLAVCY